MQKRAPTVVGTWAMVQAWNMDANGVKSYRWGNPSAGYWVYDKSGHFSLIISQNPALPIPTDPFSGDPQPNWLFPAPPWEVPNALMIETFATASPFAYFGTYTVEMDPSLPGHGTIQHHVFADVMRAYTNTIQPRPFVFDGDEYLNVGEAKSYLRRLQRLT